MKNIYLLGDSIRVGGGKNSPGYGWLVADMLNGKANVIQPKDNCRFTVYTLRMIRNWFQELGDTQIDIIHWNNGLWDMCKFDGDEENLVPIELYKVYLKRIYDHLRTYFPNARIIFATSTPIVESAYGPNFVRTNAEIRRYNEAAKEVLCPLGVEINDLYAFCEKYGPEDYADGKTHFNTEADMEIAKEVCGVLGF